MLKRLLMWLFGKRSKKRSNPKRKHNARELVKEKTKSGATEKDQKITTKKRRNKKMADEKEVKTEEKVETKKEDTSVEKKDDATKPVAEDKVETEDKKEEVETKETETADKVEPSDKVEDVGNSAEGIRISDIVTKDMLDDRFAALEAKLEAWGKENKDLKDELTKKDDELNGMKNKYEIGNFGGMQKQGLIEGNDNANSQYHESAKDYLEKKLGIKLPSDY